MAPANARASTLSDHALLEYLDRAQTLGDLANGAFTNGAVARIARSHLNTNAKLAEATEKLALAERQNMEMRTKLHRIGAIAHSEN